MKKITGDCYKANWNWILDNYSAIKDSNDCFLCHGKVIGAKDSEVEGKIFGHAWIEQGDTFIDCSNNKTIIMKKEKLYASGRIIINSVKKYTPTEAMAMILKYEHYGNWE